MNNVIELSSSFHPVRLSLAQPKRILQAATMRISLNCSMPVWVCLLFTFSAATLRAELTEEQRQVALEAAPADSGAAKIVLMAGSPSNKPGQHEYFAGCALMMEWLKAIPGVAPVMVAEGWPQNETTFNDARCVLLYMDGGARLPFLDSMRWDRIKQLADAGVGLVILHQTIDCPPEHAADFKSWFGAVFQSDIGCRGHWDVEFTEIGKHPTLQGLHPFTLTKDGWLYNLHFAGRGVTHVLKAKVPDDSRKTDDAQAHTGRAETVAWAFERPNGGRSFGFTGADLHANWADENQRRLVLNALLWTAKVEVPAAGVESECTPEMLKKNLDRKIFATKGKKS